MPEETPSTPDEGEANPRPLTPEERHLQNVEKALTPSVEEFGHFEDVPGRAPQPDKTVIDEARPDVEASFDPKFREDFEGLLYLGKLQKRFQWMGHSFIIRTLYVDEILEVGLLQRDYVGTMGEMKAYQAATVAASLVSVDGKPLPRPITNEPEDTQLVNTFEYINRTWSPIVLDAVFNQYLDLERQVTNVMARLGGASG